MERVWTNFVKESFSRGSDSEYKRDINRIKLSGPEAKSIYDNITNANGCEKNNKLQLNSTDISKPRKIPKVDFNVNSFLKAAQNNDVSFLISMLKSHPNIIDCSDSFGWTALMCACHAGCSDAVDFLIENGADVNKVDNSGRSAYSIAKHAKQKHIASNLKAGKKNKKKSHYDRTITSKREFCHLCQESIDDIDSHTLSIEHNLNKNKIINRIYGLPETNKGYQLMLKSGWNADNGLGPNGVGDKFPVKTALKLNTSGLGFDKPKARITHFKANDKSAIQPVFKLILKHQDRRKQAEERSRDRRMEIQFRNEFA